jgi:tetratricopeptide (TPR) repeat protein
LRLAGALALFWFLCGYTSEGRCQLEQVLTQSSCLTSRDPAGRSLHAKALYGLGILQGDAGSVVKARALLAESLALSRESGDTAGVANALFMLGVVRVGLSDPRTAHTVYQESLMLFRALGDTWHEACVLSGLGHTLLMTGGDRARVQALYEESLRLFHALGDPLGRALGRAIAVNGLAGIAVAQGDHGAAQVLYEEMVSIAARTGVTCPLVSALESLAYVALEQGEATRARDLLTEGLRLWRQEGNWLGIVRALAGLAGVAAAQGQAGRAGRLFAVVHAAFPKSGMLFGAMFFPTACVLIDGSHRAWFDHLLAKARTDLDMQAFNAGWSVGTVMALEDAIAEAVGETEEDSLGPAARDCLVPSKSRSQETVS